MPPQIWPKSFKHLAHVKLFLLSLSIVLSLVIAGIFMFLYARTHSSMLRRVKDQAATYADLIIHTRAWNMEYGGLYVEKKPGVEPNIYLRQLGINPDVKAEKGRTFTLRNHAIMIKEISRRSEQDDGTSFRIVSAMPLDPENTPDPLEREALASFKLGTREYSRLIQQPLSSARFRYVVPMYADQGCLDCHNSQGYRVGSVIGAISVTIPVAKFQKETDSTRLLLLLAALAAIGSLVGITYFLTWRLAIKLDDVQHRLKMQASTDALTGLKNRRVVMNRLEEEFQRARRLGEPLSLIILDLDNFKSINDQYGHLYGDLVLRSVAAVMKETLRSYDIIGRIGGEEFLIVSPGSSPEDSAALAERLLNQIRHEIIDDGHTRLSVTASAGVTMLASQDSTPGMLLKRADAAMYRAKQEGRNRVVTL